MSTPTPNIPPDTPHLHRRHHAQHEPARTTQPNSPVPSQYRQDQAGSIDSGASPSPFIPRAIIVTPSYA